MAVICTGCLPAAGDFPVGIQDTGDARSDRLFRDRGLAAVDPAASDFHDDLQRKAVLVGQGDFTALGEGVFRQVVEELVGADEIVVAGVLQLREPDGRGAQPCGQKAHGPDVFIRVNALPGQVAVDAHGAPVARERIHGLPQELQVGADFLGFARAAG